MTGNLDTKQLTLDKNLLGKPEKCYIEENGIGALETQLKSINSIDNEDEKKEEFKNLSNSIYDLFYAKKNKRNIVIVSTLTVFGMVASFSTILATTYYNLRENVQLPLEVGLYVLMVVFVLILSNQMYNFLFNPQVANDNNIQVLATRLKGYADYVNPKGCSIRQENHDETQQTFNLSKTNSAIVNSTATTSR